MAGNWILNPELNMIQVDPPIKVENQKILHAKITWFIHLSTLKTFVKPNQKYLGEEYMKQKGLLSS
jgi:hypothetical protein